MLITDSPAFFLQPWASAGINVNAIPAASQIGVTAGKASLTDGFPPLCFQPIPPIGSGIPMDGGDLQGILKWATETLQYLQSGGHYRYDSAAATAISGYPKGAVIASSDGLKLWISTVNNNATDPDGVGASGWVEVTRHAFMPQVYEYATAGTYSRTVPAGYYRMRARAVGAGGGGAAGATATHGEGGGGGEAAEKRYSVTPGGSVSIVVGAGGAGLISTSGGAASGGNSTITYSGVTITGSGGAGAIIVDTNGGTPGAGGTASGGDINHAGQPGANGGTQLLCASGGRPGGGDGWGAMADGSSPLPVGVRGGGGAGAPGVVSAGGDGWAFVEFF